MGCNNIFSHPCVNIFINLFVKSVILFLIYLRLENLEVMFNTGFYINDLSMHDSSRDLVLVGNIFNLKLIKSILEK